MPVSLRISTNLRDRTSHRASVHKHQQTDASRSPDFRVRNYFEGPGPDRRKFKSSIPRSSNVSINVGR